jgi:hypothetical protein
MTIIANDPNPPNRDVGRPDSQWQLNVDSGRPLCAKSGHSPTVQLDPTRS